RTFLDDYRNHQGTYEFYYAPGLFGKSVFGIIDIFNTTAHLTDAAEKGVPKEYQYLFENTINSIFPYTVILNSRSTTWRYIISKKYNRKNGSGIDLIDLSVEYKDKDNKEIVGFGSNSSGEEKIVFHTKKELPISEVQISSIKLKLKASGKEIRILPAPSLTTALQKAPDGPEGFCSDMYVYV
ncbi:MAG: hypothetical protein D3909_06605, partial [Candidatus Electrothrix sp. ATG1]|nr:hypothetical protein [Candidatus Electrothrix sp. ATG1]